MHTSYPGSPHSATPAFDSLHRWVPGAGLQTSCCPGGLLACPNNIPTSCDAACAQALLGFVGDCSASFASLGLGPAIDPVVALCEQASDGRTYTLHREALPWTDAEAACVAAGGHLASMHSAADVSQVMATGAGGNTWVGLNDLAEEAGCDGDAFDWIDGTSNDFNNWSAGEPNDWNDGAAHCDGGAAGIGSQGDADGGEDCVELSATGTWNEASCARPQPFVCESGGLGDGAVAEIGGNAIDHFVDDNLEHCSNLAEGRTATQSSTVYGGDPGRAVDGSGLDGSWGSGSCTHTNNQGATWWQVDLGSVSQIRAVQLVNRADCCQDRLVGARVIISSTPDYTADGKVNCGSVTADESAAGAQSLIIKTCDPGTRGRYVTVQQRDDSYLTLCEVVVYGACDGAAPPATVTSALGSNCHYRLHTEPLPWDQAEAACVAAGGHLASIHSAAEQSQVVATGAGGNTWVGLNDLAVEAGCDGDAFVWVDGTSNEFNNWSAGEPNDWNDGAAHCDGGAAGIGSQGDADGGEDCVELSATGTWNEASCARPQPFVCRSCKGRPASGGGGH